MVAEHPCPDLLGAMMLSEEWKVVLGMVSLAMVFLLSVLARSLVNELVKKEEIERTISVEDEVPELFYSPYGQRAHVLRSCHGLRNANSVNRCTLCAVCCPGRMRMKEQEMMEYRRTFHEVLVEAD